MVASRPITGDFESRTGRRWVIHIEQDNTGFAFVTPAFHATAKAPERSDQKPVDLKFREGLYDDVAGFPYRFSRVLTDPEFAGVNLVEVLR